MTVKEKVKSVASKNTVQSIAIPLAICVGLMVFGKAFPQYTEPSITNAAVGGVLLGVTALITRYLKGVFTKTDKG
jgi:uncharacterized membrane protein